MLNRNILLYFISVLAFLGCADNAFAIPKSFNVASGNWNTPGNWNPSGVPGSSDDVTIPAGSAVAVDVAAFCNTLSFGNTSNNACSITISASNSLTITGTITYVVPAGNTNDQTINVGSGTLSCTSIIFANTASGQQDNNFNVSSGIVNVTGNITFNGASTENAFNIIGAGTLNIGGTVSGSGTFTVNANGATVNYNGITQTIKATTYTNLTLSGSGGKTFPSGTTTVNGILSIENGTSSNTFTGTLSYGAAATLQYNTTSTRTASTEWVTPFVATGGVEITNSGIIRLNGAKQLGNNTNVDLNINPGATLSTSVSNYGLTFHGDFINAGTISAGSSTVTIGGTLATQSIGSFSTTGTVTLSKTSGTATFTADVTGFGLTINGSGGTLNLGSGLIHTFTGQISLTAGTLNGGSSTLNANRVSASAWNGTGSNFVAGTSTVVFGAAGNQTIATATTFYNLTLNNSGVLTFGSGTTTVNSILSIEGVTSLAFTGSLAYGAAATLQYNRSTSLTTSTEWVTPFVATGGVIIKNTGTITLNASKQFGNNTNVDLNINSGATLSTSGSNFGLTFHGDFINAGTLSTGSSAITFAGTVATQSIESFTTTGNVSMTKTSGTATLIDNVNANALSINGSGGTLNAGTGLTHTFTGNITLTAGTLNGGSSTINANSSTASAWTGTGSNFTASASTVVFGGTTQTINTATTFNNLTIANSGTKTAGGNIITNATLTISSGCTLNMSTRTLTLNGDFINDGSETGSGPVNIAGTATQSIGAITVTGATNAITMSKTAGIATFTNNINGFALTINGVGGTLDLGSGLVHTFTGQITLTTGTLNGGSSTLNANRVSASAWNGTGSNFVAGTSTVVFGAAGNQTIATATTFYNLTLNNSGILTFGSGTTTVNNILSIEGITSLTFTGTLAYGASATLQYNRSSSLTSSNEWTNPFVASGGIIIKNTGTITMGAAKQIGNNTNVPLNINSGATLNTGNQILRFHGDFINAGTLSAGSSTIDINGTTATQNIAGFTTTGSVTMTKTSGIAIFTGNVNGAPLTINGTGGTLNVGVSLTHSFTGDISLTAGTLNGGSSTINANSSTATAWNGTGTNFTASSGTVVFGGISQTINTTTTFNNLTISNSGVKTFGATITVNGILSMEGTATVSSAPTYGASATLQYNTTTNRTAGIEWVTPFIASGGIINANSATITIPSSVTVNSLLNLTGGKITIGANTLTLNGNFNGSSANCLVGNGSTSSLSIGGSGAIGNLFFDQTTPGTSNRLKDFTLNRSGQTLTLGNSLELIGTLTLSNGTFASAGLLTLVSNASGTARIAAITGTGAISGNVTAQRFIPGGNSYDRAYRFLASPVSGQTFAASWQQDIHITGPGSGGTTCPSLTQHSNGFDANHTTTASIYTYNETTGAWVSLANTNSTNLSSATAYRVFVRGNRAQGCSLLQPPYATAQNATLKASGTITTGQVNISLTKTSTGWNLVPNPYPSAIDWNNATWVAARNGNIGSTIYIWNPASGIAGQYASWNPIGGSVNGGSNIIQSGQSFFVNTSAPATLTFEETYKSTDQTTQLFGKTGLSQNLKIQLSDSALLDETVIFTFTGCNHYSDAFDGIKLSFGNGSIATSTGVTNDLLTFNGIEPFNHLTSDTILLKTGLQANKSYNLNFIGIPGFNRLNTIVYLHDNYSNTITNLTLSSHYSFASNTDTDSYSSNRFFIIFASPSSLPVILNSFNAQKTESSSVKISWNTASEINSSHFVTERSHNNIDYSEIALVKSIGNSSTNNNYAVIDNKPYSEGLNYYRLKQIDLDGVVTYSGIRVVDFGSPKNSAIEISVYPNPIVDENLVFSLSAKEQKGITVTITDINGNNIMDNFNLNSVDSKYTIPFQNLNSGVYILHVNLPDGNTSRMKFVK